MRERRRHCALARMIPRPSVAVTNLVSQQNAGVPATLTHHFIVDQIDHAAFGGVISAREHRRLIDVARYAQLFECWHYLDGEIAVIGFVVLDWRQERMPSLRCG